MRRALALAALALPTCGLFDFSSPEVEIPPPDFGGILLPDLTGEVVVTDADGEPVASAALSVEGNSANAVVPGLSPGVDLEVSVRWLAATLVVAHTEPKGFRVDAGGTTTLDLKASDYLFPDDDGDGAANAFEIAFAAEEPDAAGAATDPTRAPLGFFNDATWVTPLPNFVDVVAVGDALGVALVVTEQIGANQTLFGHVVHEVSLATHARRPHPFACDDSFAFGIAVRPNLFGAQGAIGCDERVQTFGLLPQFALQTTLPVTAGLTRVAYSKNGSWLYAVGPNEVLAYDANTPTAPGTEIPLLLTSLVCDLADTGTQLLIADCGLNLLHVVPHHDGAVLSDDEADITFTDFEELVLPNPTSVVVHPAGHRAYVGTNEDGAVHVVDITGEYPILDWRDVAVIPVGPAPIRVAIDPRGYWVYASSTTRLVRISTLTHQVEWELSGGEEVVGAFSDLSLSAEGRYAGVSAIRSFLELGFSSARRYETEPNHDLASASPLPGTGVGWVSGVELGTIPAGALFDGDDATDSYEDLWRLESSATFTAVAVIPAAVGTEIYKAGILDGAGLPTEEVGLNLAATGANPQGTGMLLFVEPTASERYVAVSAHDAGGTSPYLVLARGVGTPTPIDEVEPNDDWQDPQVLSAYPVAVSGTVAKGDPATLTLASEIYPDCFRVNTLITHLAMRLDFAAGDDLDLAVVNDAGVRVNAHVLGGGNRESFAFEPRTPETTWTVCVGIPNANANASGDYVLTVVNLVGG